MPRKATKPAESNALAFDQARHIMRYMRVENGETPAAIARAEGVSVRTVERSLKTVEFQRAIYTRTNLNASITGMLMEKMARAGKTLERNLDAKEYVEQKNPDGSTNLIPVDDKATQLKALEIYLKGIETMQPKGGGQNIRVQQTNAQAAISVASTGGGGYETMLHELIKESNKFNALPPKVADVMEADDGDEGEEEEEGMVIEG